MAQRAQQPAPSAQTHLPPPARDVVDGIPDRATHRPAWRYLLLAGLFLAWLGVLVGLYLWGKP